ncbi:SRPBCC family protein [Streptosporangium saharense]|uniref:SRPBCC family protein n=1 Tax=Streptosporangium saharense TaxID=1706840 RepID=UPI003433FD58
MSPDTADGIVVDRSANTLRISRTYTAKVERVWWAWTDAEAVTRWWGPQGWAATVHEMDVRPGGRWRFEIAPVDGSAAPVRSIATYTTVVDRRELAYDDVFADAAWRPEGTDSFPTSVTFTSTGDGCVVSVAVSFPDGRALQRAVELQMADGYAEALDRLGGLLGGPHPTKEK